MIDYTEDVEAFSIYYNKEFYKVSWNSINKLTRDVYINVEHVLSGNNKVITLPRQSGYYAKDSLEYMATSLFMNEFIMIVKECEPDAYERIVIKEKGK